MAEEKKLEVSQITFDGVAGERVLEPTFTEFSIADYKKV